MRFLSGLMLCAAWASAPAQVVLTANAPQYNFQVLAGSQRQISVKLTGGTTNRINWSLASTTGGASATLDHGANTVGVTNVTIGPAQGTCTISGGIGNYKVTSPATITVQAQSVDDPSKIASFLFNVCANTTSVDVAPAYQQAYKGQKVEIQTWVTGNTDESGTWSVVSKPTGGDPTFPDTNRRDLLFSATVSGRYVMQYTTPTGKSATATVYVSPNAMPGYTSTTNLTQPTECYPDPGLGGKLYEVGPGLAYATMRSVPMNTWSAGSIMRIHNLDTSGSNPTTYHESVRIIGSGTPQQPLIICGVPDSAGNMPVVDGANAQSPAWANPGTQAYGVVSVWGSGIYNSVYTAGSAGPDYVIVSGLAIQHAGPAYNFVSLNGGTPTPYADGASCVNVRSGTHLLIEGNDMNLCTNGMFVANNAANTGFSQETRYVDVRGNRLRNSSGVGAFGTHDAYLQSWYTVIEGNRFESLVPGAFGDALKDRGIESIIRYNIFNAQIANQLINFQSETDSQTYVAFEPYLGAAGLSSCNAIYCDHDTTLDADHLTAFQEQLEKDFVYGNIFSARTQFLADIQYGDTGGQNAPYANATEMADHQGRLYFYNNTEDQPGLAVFATLSGTNNGSDPEQQFMKPTVISANNIFYKTQQAPNIFAFTRNASFVGVWQTNLMNAGTFTIAPPIQPLPSTGTSAMKGWDSYTDQFQYPLDQAIELHQTGLTAANFLTTPTANRQPYNPVTFAPTADGGAIGAGTPIADAQASLLPVRSQYSVDSASVIARTSATTVGAVDTGSQPNLVSIAASPQALAILSTLKSPAYTPTQLPLMCTYSNGVTTDCGPAVSLSANTNAVSLVVGNRVLANSTGYGTIFASLNGVTSSAIPFSVNGAVNPNPTAPSAPKPTIVSVQVTPASLALSAGAIQQLQATAVLSDSSSQACTPSSWSSGAPSIATVSSSGLVTALAGGMASVTASCSGFTSSPATVTVTPLAVQPPIPTPPTTPTTPVVPTITAVALSPASSTLVTGSTEQLLATATYSDTTTQSCTPTQWTSSVPSIVTVSGSGVVSAVTAGSSTVTAVCGGVASAPSGITVSAARVKAWTMRPITP